ncbi:MAG: RluA family pseudouridine synthase [bacterium]
MKLIVSCEEPIRIDKYISMNTDYSRNLIEKMIDGSCVTVNGKVVKSSCRLKNEDVIEIDEDFKEEVYLEKADIDLNIIYEDNDLMVINKQSGLVVHPGSGNKNNTLVNGLLNYTSELSDESGEARAGIVHRIDKDTSGIILVAKNNKAHEVLAAGFKAKAIKREYIALVEGIFPSQNAKINAPIGKCKTDFRKQEVMESGKVAVTNLAVIKRFAKYTLVRLSLETGRTHQIRVHLEYIGHPIFNDPVYNNKKSTDFGQFLHSASIDFNHPITNELMHFDAPLPEEFESVINSLD